MADLNREAQCLRPVKWKQERCPSAVNSPLDYLLHSSTCHCTCKITLEVVHVRSERIRFPFLFYIRTLFAGGELFFPTLKTDPCNGWSKITALLQTLPFLICVIIGSCRGPSGEAKEYWDCAALIMNHTSWIETYICIMTSLHSCICSNNWRVHCFYKCPSPSSSWQNFLFTLFHCYYRVGHGVPAGKHFLFMFCFGGGLVRRTFVLLEWCQAKAFRGIAFMLAFLWDE